MALVNGRGGEGRGLDRDKLIFNILFGVGAAIRRAEGGGRVEIRGNGRRGMGEDRAGTTEEAAVRWGDDRSGVGVRIRAGDTGGGVGVVVGSGVGGNGSARRYGGVGHSLRGGGRALTHGADRVGRLGAVGGERVGGGLAGAGIVNGTV